MKKFFVLFLSSLIILSACLCGCSDTEKGKDNKTETMVDENGNVIIVQNDDDSTSSGASSGASSGTSSGTSSNASGGSGGTSSGSSGAGGTSSGVAGKSSKPSSKSSSVSSSSSKVTSKPNPADYPNEKDKDNIIDDLDDLA